MPEREHTLSPDGTSARAEGGASLRRGEIREGRPPGQETLGVGRIQDGGRGGLSDGPKDTGAPSLQPASVAFQGRRRRADAMKLRILMRGWDYPGLAGST